MARELLDLGSCLSFQIQKTDYNVGHLHAGIVDVVLYIYFAPGESQQANKRIAKDGVTQMTYMCRLVGIDTRVLDQNFAGRPVRSRLLVRSKCRGESSAVHTSIDITGAGHLKFFEALDLVNAGNNFLRDLAWRLAHFAGKFKGQRSRVLPKFHGRRLLDDNLRQIDAICTTQKIAQTLCQTMFQNLIQGSL